MKTIDASSPHTGDGGWDLSTALLDALDARVPPLDRTVLHRLRAEIIARRDAERAPDTDPDALRYTATLLAAHRLLRERGHVAPVEVLSEAQRAAVAPITGWTALGLDAAPDAFAAMREISRDREDRYFGGSFQFERPRDDAGAYHLHVTGCAFVRWCAAEGAPELGPLLCAVDAGWIAAIVPERHGLTFRRPTTIAGGDDRCRFEFERTPR